MATSSGRRVFTHYADEAWQGSAFRLVLLALLSGSAAGGPAAIRTALDGAWPGYLIPVAALVGAVGVITTTLLGRPSWRDRRGAAFRTGEVLLLLIGARLVIWGAVEGFPTVTVLRDWLLNPLHFLSGEYLFAVIVWLFVWSLASAMTADFLELAIQPDEVAARLSREWGDSRSQWRAGRPRGRNDVLQGFALRWIGVGILLVVCVGVTRVDLSVGDSGVVRLGLRGLDLRPEIVASLVCYFLSGLLLMSHGRLAVLRGRWYNQEIEIRDSLIRRWHLYSLAFVGLIALGALLLPLGSTGWFIAALEWVIALIVRIILFIGFLIGLLASLLVALLTRLLGESPLPETEEVIPPLIEAIPSQAEMASRLPPWLGGAVLWLVVLVVAAFLLMNFLRTSGLLQSRFGGRLVQWRLWWRARQAKLGALVKTQIRAARRRLRPLRRRVWEPQGPAPGRGPLVPREQIRRYYLAAVKEASEQGVARPPHETPLEYAEELTTEWPESREDVQDLTHAFVEARYSQREIGADEVTGTESTWRRLVRGLRAGRKSVRQPRRSA